MALRKSRLLQVIAAGGGSAPPLATPLGVVFEGDSITQGIGSNTASYPAQFSTNTGQTISNSGNSGDTMATMLSAYAGSVAGLYNASTKNTLCLNGGTNDIGNAGQTDLQLRTTIQSYCSAARATGYKIIVSTITPRSDAGWDVTKEGYRTAFNTWLRSTYATFSDGLIDYDQALLGTDLTNPYLWQDQLHPHNTISRVMAELVRTRFALAYVPNDSIPSAFSFTDVTGATVSTDYTSAVVSLAGFTAPAAISITGGTYSINGGAFTASAGFAVPYDSVRAKLTSSGSASTAANAVVTIGGVSDTYTVTTAAPAAAFNTTPLNGGWTFSNSNRTALENASPTTGTVLIGTAIAGKKCFAVTIDAGGSVNYPLIGVSDGGATAGSLFTTAGACALICNSFAQIWINSSAVSSGPAAPNGATVGVAVDVTAKRMWFTIDGTNWFGEGYAGALATSAVIAGTGGQSIATPIPGATVYGAVGSSDSASKQFTLLTSWPWTLPTGFTLL